MPASAAALPAATARNALRPARRSACSPQPGHLETVAARELGQRRAVAAGIEHVGRQRRQPAGEIGALRADRGIARVELRIGGQLNARDAPLAPRWARGSSAARTPAPGRRRAAPRAMPQRLPAACRVSREARPSRGRAFAGRGPRLPSACGRRARAARRRSPRVRRSRARRASGAGWRVRWCAPCRRAGCSRASRSRQRGLSGSLGEAARAGGCGHDDEQRIDLAAARRAAIPRAAGGRQQREAAGGRGSRCAVRRLLDRRE